MLRKHRRTILSLAVAIAMLLFGGFMRGINVIRVADAFSSVINTTSKGIIALQDVQASASEMIAEALAVSSLGESEMVSAEREELEEAHDELNEAIAVYQEIAEDEEERQFAADLQATGDEIYARSINVIEISASEHDHDALAEAVEELEEAEIDFRRIMTRALDVERDELTEQQALAEGLLRTSTITVYITTFLSLIAACAITYFIWRNGEQKARHTEQMEARNIVLAKTNQELEVAQRQAQEANRLKSQFLAVMSHELRTPLNAMLGFAEIMLAGMGGNIDDDAKHMVERIHYNSQRLLALINDVLDLSKIEAQRIDVVIKPLSVQHLADNLKTSMASLAVQKGLDFTVEVDPDLTPHMMGDESVLNRIATNLLSNAFKFTEKGSISLRLQEVSDDQWAIIVKDTGIGIPPHALNFIFDPFRQVDGSSQRAYGGTGLGLAIVRELVRSMNGQVSVQSTVGKGSEFTVTLPIILQGEPQQEMVR